jgi:predicted  nucleic acid-binding Zn-ribbon protein
VQLSELQRETEPLRAASATSAAALAKATEERARTAARLATVEAELEAKSREVEQLGAMCSELMGAAESKFGTAGAGTPA